MLMWRKKIILRADTIMEESQGREERKLIFYNEGQLVKNFKKGKEYSSVLLDQKHLFVEITGHLSRCQSISPGTPQSAG